MNHQDSKAPSCEDKVPSLPSALRQTAKVIFLVSWCLGGLLLLPLDAQAAKKKKAPSPPVAATLPAPAPAEVPAPMSESRKFVKSVQEMLAKAGYMNDNEADGRLGAKTREALKRFQKDNGLKDDGRLTPEAFERLARKTHD
jgi:peptidoglycan hydrolase-like protein with peptidoglycan-binding domain